MPNKHHSLKIYTAKLGLVQAQRKVVDAYLHTIRYSYDCLSDQDKVEVIDNLESILTEIDEKIPDIAMRRISTAQSHDSKTKSRNFNRKIAMTIREKEGLTRPALLRELKVGRIKSSETLLYRYETGGAIPVNPPKVEFVRKYLGWLKNKGYNPYNI